LTTILNSPTRISFILLLIVIGEIIPNFSNGNGTAEAEVFLSGILEETLKILKSEGFSGEDKRTLLADNINANLDLVTMSERALGPSRQNFTKKQFAEFSQEFTRHLTHFYLRRLETFKGDKIKITDSSFNKKSRVVKIRTLGGVRHNIFQSRRSSHIAKVDYHLREKNAEWRIISITIDGVNVSRSFRKQFKAMLDKETPDVLISKMRSMNIENEARNLFY